MPPVLASSITVEVLELQTFHFFQDHGNDNISKFSGATPPYPLGYYPPPPPPPPPPTSLKMLVVLHEKGIIPTCPSNFQYAFYAP